MKKVPIPGWSTHTCSELKWKFQANKTFPNVCGASHLHKAKWNPDRPGCFGKKIYSEAYRTCMDAGGRLCTFDEVIGGVVFHTGCAFDYFRIWTSTPCKTAAGKEGRMTQAGGTDKWEIAKNPERCIAVDDKTTTLPTRCCADKTVHAWRKPSFKLAPVGNSTNGTATAVTAKPPAAGGPVSKEGLRNMAIAVLVLLLIVIFLSIVLYFSAWERQLCGSYLVVTMLNQHGREFLKLNGEYRVFRSHREAYPRLVDNINTVISVIEAHYLSDIVATIGSVLLGAPSTKPETPLRSFGNVQDPPPYTPTQARPFFESGSIPPRDPPIQGAAPRPAPVDRAWPWDGFRFSEDGRPLTVAYVGRGPDGSLSGRVDRPGWGRPEGQDAAPPAQVPPAQASEAAPEHIP
jgi:hypothetical protein